MCAIDINLKDFFFPSLPVCLPTHLSVSQQYSVYPIIWAAGRGHADIVQLLLQNGAKVNCSDKVGQQDLPGSVHVVSTQCVWLTRIFIWSYEAALMYLMFVFINISYKGIYLIDGFPISVKIESVSHSVVSDSLWPHEQPARLLCPWDSPDKNTGVGCHSLLQGIFLTQGWNLGLLHCRQILYCLSHQGSPNWYSVSFHCLLYHIHHSQESRVDSPASLFEIFCCCSSVLSLITLSVLLPNYLLKNNFN